MLNYTIAVLVGVKLFFKDWFIWIEFVQYYSYQTTLLCTAEPFCSLFFFLFFFVIFIVIQCMEHRHQIIKVLIFLCDYPSAY